LARFSLTEDVKRRFPWFIKIPLKIVLSRLPFRLRSWQRVNLFRAGAMDSPAYAWDIFKKHYQAVSLADLRDANVLELGPGNSLLTALFAKCHGAAKTWLIDGEHLTSEDASLFARAEQMLTELRVPVPGVGTASSMDGVLNQLNSRYLTSGLASLQTVGDGTIDFLFSNAVLEHVRLADFAEIIKQTRRVLKPTGVASHVIDFRDHLQNALNNLRFSKRIWEADFMARSGFYTNRLTWPAMDRLFRENGFSVELRSFERWPDGLPTKQGRMAAPFKHMRPEELMISLAHVVLRPISR